MNTLNENSIVVGVDVHKYSHTAVAMNAWGEDRGTFNFSNDNLETYADWLNRIGPKENIVIGLEDVNSYGIHLVERLRRDDYHIRYVPAILTERERKTSTKRHKSDSIDAKRVGKVILAKYEETLPAKESIAEKRELETAKSLDLLLMERRDLTRNKTIVKNQLHCLIHQHYTESYRKVCPRSFTKKAIKWFLNDLKGNNTILAASIMRRLERLLFVEKQIYDISKEIAVIGEHSKEAVALAAIHGCGMVTACSIIAEVITVKRFKNKHHFSMYAGIAPTPHSSGRKNKMHTNPFGNRQLNKAIHTIALGQIAVKGDPRGKEYYQRKLKEGKTKLWALRCLKHQIAKVVFQKLRHA
ncbi:MAG: IS110 family transposase [Patescibacteria group bacterium]|nr:IS110 family transposase [Nitrososphaerota archaeon]MDE2227393.1 IS110 family transposase [Patescibacteria group bacterium]